MGISIAAALVIYIPIAGLIMLANVRQRQQMKRMYIASIALSLKKILHENKRLM
jgi:hypothetical protein